MKKKRTEQKTKRGKKQAVEPNKGCLESLSQYFGSYLDALELVRARQ
ncbi:MAG: hypothetical protein JXR25_04850 [Pontiellaceae bacterium]|nr:hypothetical protein [Pontiellaceae bacterium]MBN2784135.1 hypothetical protein [Pontiellaceae bacterium]